MRKPISAIFTHVVTVQTASRCSWSWQNRFLTWGRGAEQSCTAQQGRPMVMPSVTVDWICPVFSVKNRENELQRNSQKLPSSSSSIQQQRSQTWFHCSWSGPIIRRLRLRRWGQRCSACEGALCWSSRMLFRSRWSNSSECRKNPFQTSLVSSSSLVGKAAGNKAWMASLDRPVL